MAKAVTVTIGSVSATRNTKTEASAAAIASAAYALNYLDRARPQIVVWGNELCIVFVVMSPEAEPMWAYTNPRTVAEVARDSGREHMGTCGYFQSATAARSGALSHLIQNDPNGIPETLPDDLVDSDRSNLDSLRVGRARLAAA